MLVSDDRAQAFKALLLLTENSFAWHRQVHCYRLPCFRTELGLFWAYRCLESSSVTLAIFESPPLRPPKAAYVLQLDAGIEDHINCQGPIKAITRTAF